MPISDQDVRDEFKAAQGQGRAGSQQMGGGPSESDQDAAGGSGGSGGYGQAQNQSFHQGQTGGPDSNAEHPAARELSRGERFDSEQGGGRDADSVALQEDQLEHQDRGQGFIASEGAADTGATSDGRRP